MIEVVVSKIEVHDNSEQQIIYLTEKKGKRVLPIVIGFTEVHAIKSKMSGVLLPRPLTHDLLSSVIDSLQGKLKKVVIDDFQAGTYFAKLVLQKENGEEVFVDARPSDGVALAVRMQAPIFIDEEVFENCAIIN